MKNCRMTHLIAALAMGLAAAAAAGAAPIGHWRFDGDLSGGAALPGKAGVFEKGVQIGRASCRERV